MVTLWLVLSEINNCSQIHDKQWRIYLGLQFEGMQSTTVEKKAWGQEARNRQEVRSGPTLDVL